MAIWVWKVGDNMIKLIAVRSEETEIQSTYTPDVRTYNIVSGLMSDDCKPYRVAQSMMIWMTESGHMGEIECIYPVAVEGQMCLFKEIVKELSGFPVFEVLCCDNEAYIQNHNNGFTLWLTKDKEVDTQIEFKQLKFLVANNELVGINCKEYVILE
jgi:hypothetical protein